MASAPRKGSTEQASKAQIGYITEEIISTSDEEETEIGLRFYVPFLENFVETALELPRDRERSWLCLLGECRYNLIKRFYFHSEMEYHAWKKHRPMYEIVEKKEEKKQWKKDSRHKGKKGKASKQEDPSKEKDSASVAAAAAPVEQQNPVKNKEKSSYLSKTSHRIFEIQINHAQKELETTDSEELKKLVQTWAQKVQTPRKRLVDFIVCVIGDCAKNHVSVFGTQAETDAHMNEVHGDTSFSMLTMNALYGTNIPGAGAKGKTADKESQEAPPNTADVQQSPEIDPIVQQSPDAGKTEIGKKRKLEKPLEGGSRAASPAIEEASAAQQLLDKEETETVKRRRLEIPEEKIHAEVPEESHAELPDEGEARIDPFFLAKFARRASILSEIHTEEELNGICLLGECPSKPLEKFYKEKALARHARAMHANDIKEVYMYCIGIIQTDMTRNESKADILKTLVKIWDREKQEGDNISICLEGDCFQDPRLFTADQALRHRSKHPAKQRDGDPFFGLRIKVLVKGKKGASQAVPKGRQRQLMDVEEEIGGPSSMVNPSEHSGTSASSQGHFQNPEKGKGKPPVQEGTDTRAKSLNAIIQRISELVEIQGEPRQSPKRLKTTSHLCLLKECLYKSLGGLYPNDEIVGHAKQVHQVKKLSSLIQYRLVVYRTMEETSDPHEGGLKTLELLLQSQGTILRSSNADDKGSLRGIQTVDKGLCMLGDCASKLGTLFDILKDLDDHALENHIKPKKPKKVVDYFTVYPLLERKNKLEQIKIKEEVQVEPDPKPFLKIPWTKGHEADEKK